MNTPDYPLPNNNRSKSDHSDNAEIVDEKKQSKEAADLIRQKINNLYSHEPSAKAEAQEIAKQGKPLSKHQHYMFELSNSGKSVAEIQTAWHEYYQNLSDADKREVWDEFYSQNKNFSTNAIQHKDNDVTAVNIPAHETQLPHTQHHKTPSRSHKRRSIADYKHDIERQSKVKQKLSAKHHFQSLIFGIGTGAFVVILLLFGFFNERFIAPFITPSRQVNSTPIISDPNSKATSNSPLIIIPKINVEIPVVYDAVSTAEADMQKALERGVVHYATTPTPGQKGNVAIFGHSSNNIFNPGKYKFAFVLLSKLENGDLFYLDKGGKRFVYKIYKKRIVEPTEVSVLDTADKPDTATLITCDPPGTSLKRLVVVGEQISPSPTANVASSTVKTKSKPATIPSNAPSLWQRFVDWL